MSKRSHTLRALVTERLTAAAEEIFALVERTIAEYEEELCRSKEENQRRQQQLDMLNPRVLLHRTTVNPTDEAFLVLKQEQCNDPQIQEAPHVQVKEEVPETLPITLHQEDTGITKETHREETGIAAETYQEETEMHTKSHKDEQMHITGAENMNEVLNNWTVPLDKDMGHSQSVQRVAFVRKQKGNKQKGNKPKSCSVCNKKFKSTFECKRHEFSHTGAKPYSCPVCKKSFVHEESVSVHMMMHTGEQLFACAVCKKRFVRKSSLKSHMNTIHRLVKPFSCAVCQKEFKLKSGLRIHMYQHTGNKPFRCPVCDKSYTRKGHLKAHMFLDHAEFQQQEEN